MGAKADRLTRGLKGPKTEAPRTAPPEKKVAAFIGADEKREPRRRSSTRTRRTITNGQPMTIYAPADFVERLRTYAFHTRRSLSDVICEATAAWLDVAEKKQ